MESNHQENEEQTNQDQVNEENTSEPQTGTIFGMHKGFGFIKFPPNNLFFHHKNAEQFETLQKGDKVQFSVSENAQGKPIAIQVRKL